MNYKLAPIIFVLLLNACKPSLKEGYQSFSIYDYFKAKNNFYHHTKNKAKNLQTGAYLGLSQIYARNDNPFYNLDSAIKYIRLADTNYELIPKKKPTLFHTTFMTKKYLDSIKNIVDDKLYLQFPKSDVIDSVTLQKQESFIAKYYDHNKINDFIIKRDSLALGIAKTQGAIGMYHFLKSYPKSSLKKNAETLRDEFIFKASIEKNNFESFDRFIQLHQKNEFKTAAIDSLYTISFKSENSIWVEKLLLEYPSEKYMNNCFNLLLFRSCYELNNQKDLKLNPKLFNLDFQNKIKKLDSLNKDLYLIYKNEKSHVIFLSENGESLAQTPFNEALLPNSGLSIINKDNGYNLANAKGQVILNTTYEDLENILPFHYIFSNQNKYGIINALGQILIPNQYDELNYNKDNNLLIALKQKKFGLISSFNKILLPFIYDNISDIKNNTCFLKIKETFIHYNIVKKELTSLPYEWVDNTHKDWVRVKLNNKFGIINYKNEKIIPCIYDRIKILNDSQFLVVTNALFGIIDYKGDTVLSIDNLYNEAVENEKLTTKNFKKTISNLGEGLVNLYNQDIIRKSLKHKIHLINNDYVIIEKNKSFQLLDLNKKQAIAYYQTAPKVLSDDIITINENKKDFLFHLSSKTKIKFEAIEKWQDKWIVKSGTQYLLLNSALQKLNDNMITDYEAINEFALKLLINNKWYLYELTKNRWIEIK